MNSEVFIAHDTVVQFKYEELEVNRLRRTSLNRFQKPDSKLELSFNTRKLFTELEV